MTSPIGAVSGPIATLPPTSPNDPTAAAPSSSTTASTGGTQSLLDPQAFLRLLVAQLQYQDPTNPTDTSQFMSQTATLTQVQTMTAMATSLTQLITAQQTATATALVGKSVSYVDPTGQQATGTVNSVSFKGGAPLLNVGSVGVPLAGVLEIGPAVATSGTAGSITTGGTTSTTDGTTTPTATAA